MEHNDKQGDLADRLDRMEKDIRLAVGRSANNEDGVERVVRSCCRAQLQVMVAGGFSLAAVCLSLVALLVSILYAG